MQQIVFAAELWEREVTISHFLFTLALTTGREKRVPNGSWIFYEDRNRIEYYIHFLRSRYLIGRTWLSPPSGGLGRLSRTWWRTRIWPTGILRQKTLNQNLVKRIIPYKISLFHGPICTTCQCKMFHLTAEKIFPGFSTSVQLLKSYNAASSTQKDSRHNYISLDTDDPHWWLRFCQLFNFLFTIKYQSILSSFVNIIEHL